MGTGSGQQTAGYAQASGAMQQGATTGGMIPVGDAVMQDMRRSVGSGQQETRGAAISNASATGAAISNASTIAVGQNVVQDARYSVGSGSPGQMRYSQENAAYSQAAVDQTAGMGANMSWVQSSVGAQQMSGGQMYSQEYQQPMYNAAYSPQQNTAPMYNEEVQYSY